MNKTQILSVDDPFRAAYLLRFGQYKETKLENGRRCFLIEGEAGILAEENYRYRTGSALINPLSLKESFDLLKELSGDNEIELEELTEPILIDGEEKEMP